VSCQHKSVKTSAVQSQFMTDVSYLLPHLNHTKRSCAFNKYIPVDDTAQMQNTATLTTDSQLRCLCSLQVNGQRNNVLYAHNTKEQQA